MQLPEFKYSPNAYSIAVFENEEGTCSVCQEKREIRYKGQFLCIQKPDYLCPWCIQNGKAAEKYEGEFNYHEAIEGTSDDSGEPQNSLSEVSLKEITRKTPSYSSWQEQIWLVHCNEPCAFIGYADAETIAPLEDELKNDIEMSGYLPEEVKKDLSKDEDLVGYLFQCGVCGQHRLHIDCS